jgi:hypothetical protein
MDILALIAEQKIQEAIRRGELDDLPLKGRPIPREDDSGVPEELRMAFKILKNAGVLPEELQIRKELLTLRDLIDICEDPGEEQKLRKELSRKMLHYNVVMERNFHKPIYRKYSDKVLKKLGL